MTINHVLFEKRFYKQKIQYQALRGKTLGNGTEMCLLNNKSNHIHNKKIRSFGFLQSVDMIEPGSVFLSDLDPKTFI